MNAEDRIRSLRAATEQSPRDPALRGLLAEALLDAGCVEEAGIEYRQALRDGPGREDLVLGLARTLEGAGRAAEAASVLESHAVVGDPSPDALLSLARLLLALDRTEDAGRAYRRAVEADPGSADPFLARRLGVERPTRKAPVEADGKVREPVRGEAGPGETLSAESERPSVTFKDVGGMESVKEEIRIKIIHPLRNPELYRKWGKPAGGGILMYGPPGCGKTHLAKATAGEVDAFFFPVGIHDVLEMWIGQSERNLHAIFEDARRRKPSVLFFDEVDALGASRADMRTAAGRQVINQLLSELDGISSTNEGVLILAATNAPWHLDPALRRPGRFDRVVFVPPPDRKARARILEILCLDRPTAGLDVGAVAAKTEGFSGADLKAVVDRAVEGKLRAAMKEGNPQPLSTKDLLETARRVEPSTREWFATARNYVLYANQSGLYDDVMAYLEKR